MELIYKINFSSTNFYFKNIIDDIAKDQMLMLVQKCIKVLFF